LSRRQKVLSHVATTALRGLEFFEGQEDFAIIIAGILFRLDVHRADETVVLAIREVRSGAHVCVIEAKAGRPGFKRDAAAAMGRDEGRAFFGCAVDVGGDELAVPVQLLRRVGVVVDVDRHAMAFFEAKKRAGKLAVVGGQREDAVGREFNRFGGDGERVVGGTGVG